MARQEIVTNAETHTLPAAFDMINSMTQELYAADASVAALRPANFVQFGAGGSADRLAITGTAGFLGAASYCLRTVLKVKFTTPIPSPTSTAALLTNEVLLHMTSGGTLLFRVQRGGVGGVNANKIGVSLGSGAVFWSTNTYTSGRKSYTIVLSYDGDRWGGSTLAHVDIYDDLGALLETFYAAAPGLLLPFNTVTAVSIGQLAAGASGEATNFAQCAFGEVRVWTGAADNAIELRSRHTGWVNPEGLGASTIAAGQTVITGCFLAGSWSHMYVGLVLTIENGSDPAFSATVAAFSQGTGADGTVTLTSGLAYAVNSVTSITWPIPEESAHIAAALRPFTGNGAIAGRDPLIAFGGRDQTAADWNAGNNLGTLGPFASVTVE